MDRKQGITHQIRLRLSAGAFADDRLWKRFSARRLELIDTLDLSLKKALEQEAEIQNVAELLRKEFGYLVEYTQDFDKLVRAAVQLVRRNRKRLLKLKKPDPKRQKHLTLLPELEEQFISEIARLRDVHDDVVDLLYPRTRAQSTVDHASATINHMLAQPKLPPLKQLDIRDTPDFDQGILKCRTILINLIDRLKLCAELVTKKLGNLQLLGQLVISACIAYVFEKLFDQVNPKLIDYLRGKLENPRHLAEFFRRLDPNAPQVTDEVAVISLYMLLGGCVKDFGFTLTMMPLAKMFFFCIMRDYPFFAKVATDFEYYEGRGAVVDTDNTPVAPAAPADTASAGAATVPPPVPTLVPALVPVPVAAPIPTPLTYPTTTTTAPTLPPLATLAEALARVLPIPLAISSTSHTPAATPHARLPVIAPVTASVTKHRKKVLLQFCDKVLEFSYPIQNSAPPRHGELIENARLAFHLANNTIVGLRDLRTHQHLLSDSDLERVFLHHEVIEIEVFTMGTKAIPIYELTLTVTGHQGGDGGNNNGNGGNSSGGTQPRYLLPPLKLPVDNFQPLL